MVTNIESLKKGDIFRIAKAKRVLVYDGYNRSTKKYSAYAYDDINHFVEKKKGTKIEVGFDF